MQVALLTHNTRAGDAIGNQIAAKVAFFQQRGHPVRVFLQDQRYVHPSVQPFSRVVQNPENDEDYQGFLRSADLVLVEYSQFYSLLTSSVLLGPQRARVVFDYHGVTPPELWPAGCPEAVEEGCRRRGFVWFADAALVHSRFAGAELCEDTGFPAERVHQLGYPLDLSRFSPAPPRRDLRRRLGLGNATVLLFVGRLAPNKCVRLLVEALAALRDRTPPVHLVLVGDAGDLYRREAEHCRQRAVQLGVAERLHVCGRVTEDQLLDAYRSADVLVMPSVHEGFCIPVIEALACGVPVTAARAGALPETVGDVGCLFRPHDAAALVRQLVRLLDETPGEKDLRRQRGLEWSAAFGRDRWQEEFGRILAAIQRGPARPRTRRISIHPRSAARTVCSSLRSVILPISVRNLGSQPLLHDGPGGMVVQGHVYDEHGRPLGKGPETSLPDLVLPGQTLPAAVRVPVPPRPGVYHVRFRAEPSCGDEAPTVGLRVTERQASQAEPPIEIVHRALAEAEQRQRLPNDYEDVSEGWFAACKRWLKRKLLGNFKQAYVDVLSRRQSAFNRHVMTALRELAEVQQTVAELRVTLDRLEKRLEQLECIHDPVSRGAEGDP